MGWRSGLALAAAVALGTIATDAPAEGDAPLVAKPAADALGKAVSLLARRGRRAEAEEVLDVLTALRVPESDVAPVRALAERALKTAKATPGAVPDAAKAVQKAAATLAESLAAAPDDAARREIAAQALRLDGSLAAAHQALGHVQKDGRWLPAEFLPCVERRAQIQDAIRRARRLDVPVETVAADATILERVTGQKGTAVVSHGISVQSVHLTPERCARQLREVIRAIALIEWLRTGKLEVPATRAPLRLVFVADRKVYEKAIVAAHDAGELNDRDFGWAKSWSGFIATDYILFRGEGEHLIGTHALFHTLHFVMGASDPPLPRLQPPLDAGILNWVHLGFLGIPMPGVGWVETTGGGKDGGGRTTDDPVLTKEREEHWRFAKAGLMGSRTYMRWLARRGEDPAWSRSMTDEVGKIAGPDLVKCTLVTDYLLETGEWESLRERTSDKPFGKEAFEQALGALADFETRWKAWLLAEDARASLVERLGGAADGPAGPTAAERVATAYLDGLRARAMKEPPYALGVDPDLSRGCAAHASYLVRHPKQAAAWPDAHEEYPDQEGFSPEGSRAGLSSVIAPGTRTPEDAIDNWMGTFYHRLPLLRPGLLKIGWGLEGGFAVLDSGSFVAPEASPVHALWPAPGAKGVPLRFNPELPNPVEGEDQSRWGYPVTVQLCAYEPDPVLKLTLHRGPKATEATLVECHLSTPSEPTNVKLAPAGAWCLIPKATLAANTTYTVRAEGWPGAAAPYEWSFTTGAK